MDIMWAGSIARSVLIEIHFIAALSVQLRSNVIDLIDGQTLNIYKPSNNTGQDTALVHPRR